MKGQTSAIVLAILCSAYVILPAASQKALGGAKGNKARTTSTVASVAGARIGPLADILAQAHQARQTKPQIRFPQGHGYPNNQNVDQSYLLPMLMVGGDTGRKFATMSMLMNGRGANNNNILPFLFMGQDNMMWPLMFMNSGRRGGRGSGMNPATMLFAMGHELF